MHRRFGNTAFFSYYVIYLLVCDEIQSEPCPSRDHQEGIVSISLLQAPMCALCSLALLVDVGPGRQGTRAAPGEGGEGRGSNSMPLL